MKLYWKVRDKIQKRAQKQNSDLNLGLRAGSDPLGGPLGPQGAAVTGFQDLIPRPVRLLPPNGTCLHRVTSEPLTVCLQGA